MFAATGISVGLITLWVSSTFTDPAHSKFVLGAGMFFSGSALTLQYAKWVAEQE